MKRDFYSDVYTSLGQMYPAELEIKETTESITSASYLDLLLSIGRDGQLHTSIYDNDFNFHITNSPCLSSNIPSSSPSYGVFISQLIRHASKLLEQGYLVERLKSSLKLYCRYLYTRPCMINHIWGLKQLWLQVNGHAWFHLQRLRWPVRNGRERKIQNENICLQRDSNPHPASPRQESCSALDCSATLVRYQVEHYNLTVFWNVYVTIPVWNRLWFDTQCKVL